MKFAKELERDLVPEWRVKYLNYKAGKKHVKAISRAITRANNATPSLNVNKKPTPDTHSSEATPPFVTPATHPRDLAASIPINPRHERQSLVSDTDVHYGSIVPTPPDHESALASTGHVSMNFEELPAPAMRVPSNTATAAAAGAASDASSKPPNTRAPSMTSLSRMAITRSASMSGQQRPGTSAGARQGYDSTRLGPQASGATMPNLTPSDIQSPRTRLRRMFTFTGPALERYRSRGEYDLRALDEVREKERDFYEFLDGELDKVETFYRQKEDQAGRRLMVVREQLHEMRNRRTSEIAEARRRRRSGGELNGHDSKNGEQSNGAHHIPLLDPLLDPLKAKFFKPGPNSKALQKMESPDHGVVAGKPDERRDYARRPPEDEVPYRTAKRKLKLALQEFYRGLELLKAYALLNRTAFRKLNKKYDKAVNARPAYRYMSEKVNKSWFVNSDVLDGHLQAVEDLYARYFERGNHKIAAGKLRSLSKKKRDESGSAFQNGLFIGTGAVFAIQGLVYGAQLLFDPDPQVRTQTSYLLQIYGGYFLMLYLFSLFCLDCKVWTANRINYPFIFEFDGRSQLDWRQLAQFPSFFLFLFGLFIWLNFTRYGSPAMYLYYPVILIFVTIWRLFFAGLYPVEFRDFFLGDMYCSLTYAMCNIELFFCIYADGWNNPVRCNSNHSRLLGFFVCLPPIWRFLQCIRRYKDTRNMFPHLVNCGKYTASILAGVFLSVYRINGTHTNLALFIAFSTVNAVYTAFWDVFMDFSLLQPHASTSLLRDITALKSRWPYYLIMTIDPILRFNWIFYALFTHDTQHSSMASFLIGFAEVTRRGMWTLLRVENEHCANVKQYKASRDVPLPYHLNADPLGSSGRTSTSIQQPDPDNNNNAAPLRTPSAARLNAGLSTGVDVGPSSAATPSPAVVEEGRTPGEESLRMRRRPRADTLGRRSIRGMLAEAHKQDFEKKRRPEVGRGDAGGGDGVQEGDEDDDDDEDEDEVDLVGVIEGSDEETRSMENERLQMREAEMLSREGRGGEL